jgi:PAS domain S-box-containing protein
VKPVLRLSGSAAGRVPVSRLRVLKTRSLLRLFPAIVVMPLDQRPPLTVAESEKRLRFLDALSQATRSLGEPHDIMRTTARLLGEHLGVNRCAYAQVEQDQNHFDLIGDYNDGVSSIVGRYAFSDFGDPVLQLMRADKPYVNPDVDSDPLTAGTDLSAYRLTEIQAVICLPLHKSGRFVAAMAVHQKVARQWSAEEVDLVGVVVARCWETLDRIRGDKALREAHQRLSLALSAGELGDWSWDAASDLIMLSDRAAAIFCLPDNKPRTRTAMHDLLHPDDREMARLSAHAAAQDQGIYSIEYRVRAGAGRWRWVSVQGKATYKSDGALDGMIGILQDVTGRRAAQEAERSQAQLLEVLNQTGAALAAELDLETLLQRVTDAATKLTGARFGAFFYNGTDEQGAAYLLYTLSGAPKEAFEKFGHPRPTALFGPTFNGAPPIRSDDVQADARYGQWAPHHGMPPGHLPVRSYLAVPVVSRTGAAIGGLFFGHPEPAVFGERSERLAVGIAAQAAIAIDNARLYAQAQRDGEEKRALLESERAARREGERANAIKDEFLATLSHELRTPLSAILGWAHILRRKISPGEADLHKGIEVIERSTRVQTQLIDDLLDMSRITSGKVRLDLQPVAPITVVEAAVDTVRPAADGAGVTIELQLDPAAGPIAADPARLQQVVWNLLVNAVKFTPRGGKVHVTLEQIDGQVQITVADSGVGIKPDFLPHIFDRFRQADGSTTRRYGGLGLGLSIVKHLVELHGGAVQADSPGQGAGATFVVKLPVNAMHSDEHAGRAASGAMSPHSAPFDAIELKGIKALVVDDEADARDLMKRVLEDCGAEVTVANGAEAALQAIQRDRPDVLISDIGMPDIDGYELLRRVRQLGPAAGGALPAIALTAFARPEDRVRALRAGFSVHVSKPVESAELIATVAALAGRGAGAAGVDR